MTKTWIRMGHTGLRGRKGSLWVVAKPFLRKWWVGGKLFLVARQDGSRQDKGFEFWNQQKRIYWVTDNLGETLGVKILYLNGGGEFVTAACIMLHSLESYSVRSHSPTTRVLGESIILNHPQSSSSVTSLPFSFELMPIG